MTFLLKATLKQFDHQQPTCRTPGFALEDWTVPLRAWCLGHAHTCIAAIGLPLVFARSSVAAQGRLDRIGVGDESYRVGSSDLFSALSLGFVDERIQ